MTDRQRRIARARLLRREGKTYDEIRAVVGPVGDDALQVWLRGIPRPPETHRSRAKLDARRAARRMRLDGATYGDITSALGVSKGSLSVWLADLPVPARVRRRRAAQLARATTRAGVATRQRAVERRAARFARASGSLGLVSERELFVAGLALYWAEGSKDKPWKR